MPDTDPERQIRPFADFLAEFDGGESHRELSEALNELAQAVLETGKVGTLTYTVKIKAAGRGDSGTVMVTDDLKKKLPVGERSVSVFFVDREGNVVRHNPAQERLPLREIPGGMTVDTQTGEISNG